MITAHLCSAPVREDGRGAHAGGAESLGRSPDVASFTWPKDDLSRRWDGKWLEVRWRDWCTGGGLVVPAGRPAPAKLSEIQVSESTLRRCLQKALL